MERKDEKLLGKKWIRDFLFKNNAHIREEEEAKKNAPLEQSISLPLCVCVCVLFESACVCVRACVFVRGTSVVECAAERERFFC